MIHAPHPHPAPLSHVQPEHLLLPPNIYITHRQGCHQILNTFIVSHENVNPTLPFALPPFPSLPVSTIIISRSAPINLQLQLIPINNVRVWIHQRLWFALVDLAAAGFHLCDIFYPLFPRQISLYNVLRRVKFVEANAKWCEMVVNSGDVVANCCDFFPLSVHSRL